MPLAPAALILALAAAPARADVVKCTQAEARTWDVAGDPALGPYRRVAVDPYYSDACKRELLGFTADFLGYAPQAGLCPGQRCQIYARAAGAVSGIANSSGKPLCLSGSLAGASSAPQSPPACKLDPEYEEVIALADHWLASQLDAELAAITAKIDSGLVPHCLLPKDCPGSLCRQSLIKLWWEDQAQTKKSGESWIKAGAFSHLLVGQGFTCPTAKQKGGTCAIYSGVALMAHYCATPKYNPSAAGTCSAQGPGFRCVAQKDLLEAAFKSGAWDATVGACDKKTQKCGVAPVLDNPDWDKEKAMQDELAAKGCAAGAAGASGDCAALSAKLQAFRFKPASRLGASAARYEGGKVWVSGQSGAFLSRLAEIYPAYGFAVARYGKDEWDRVLADLALGHPVQVDLDVKAREGYGGGSEVSPHAVVLEGSYVDESGPRILVRDSNDPAYLKAWPAAEAKAALFERGQGGLGVCPPTDPDAARRCKP